MPAPYPRRGPQQGQARALNRGAKGMAGGKFAGLSPVRSGNANTPVEEQFVWRFDDYQAGDAYFGAAGALAPDASVSISTLTFVSTGLNWLSSNGSAATVTRSGLYSVQYSMGITGTLGTGYVKAVLGYIDRRYYPEPASLPRPGIDCEVTTPIFAGTSLGLGTGARPAVVVTNKTSNSLTLGDFYVSLVPIFFATG